MKKERGTSSEAAELRRRAEKRLQENPAKLQPPGTEAATQKLLHELQIHQVELEMQNDALRQARDEAEKALERYADLYDFAPVGYLTLAPDGTIRAANLTGAGLLGVERSRLVGRRFGQFVAADARHDFAAYLEKVFASPARVACELALLQGTELPDFVQIEAVAAASGQECRAALIDISLRRQLEEKVSVQHTELAVRAAELEAANMELEAFNYTVSHDLRTPLVTIHGYCQLLRDARSHRLDEQAHGFIEEIFEASQHMGRLISALLRFSHTTRAEMRRQTVDLSALAETVFAELNRKAPERRVRSRSAPGIRVEGDCDLLRVAMENLIGNAWKHAGRREGAVIQFDQAEVDGQPVCFVRDNGPGFDMAVADKLFLPFQRLPGTEAGGDGIGLAIVDRIIRRHGGKVWAESKPGAGATFFFTLEQTAHPTLTGK